MLSVQGLEALERELQLDMQRLWLRNLGRDDRLIGGCRLSLTNQTACMDSMERPHKMYCL